MKLKNLALIAALVVSQTAVSLTAVAAAEPGASSTSDRLQTAAVTGTEASPSPQASVSPSPTPTATEGPAATSSAEPSATASPSASAPVNATATPSASPGAAPSPAAAPYAVTPAASAASGQLVLMMNSNKMYLNGSLYLAGQPMAVKNGVSYIAIRALVERLNLQFTYDYKTKETIIKKDGNELRFKTNSKMYTVNGKPTAMKGPAYQYKNTFMVPLTSITQALGIPYTVDNVQKRVILTLSSKPKASFTVQPGEIFAGETTVTYTTSSSASNGAVIANERWEGRQDVFAQPGAYTVSYWVQDSNGEWSDPYTLTIQVQTPNRPPVAMFTTDKDEYKIGEPITITNTSSDPDGDTLTESWSNRALAFFNPGQVPIQLTVTDSHGLSSTYEKIINITSEVMYNQEDFNKLFVPLGDLYVINGAAVPNWPKVTYTSSSEPVTLIRSNSPETVYSEGIVYRETAMGNTRIMVHHKNSMSTNMKMYVIATNNNLYAASLNTQALGFGGPIDIPTATGKKSIETYFQSKQTGSAASNIVLQPGESKAVLTTINNVTMKPGQVISMLADVFSDYPLQYSVIMVDSNKDPLAVLPTLPLLDRDGVHNRGTYPDANRNLVVNDLLGLSPSRLVLGYNADDPNLTGTDALSGTDASNSGNFGVIYKITLNRVAPNTLITLNPRGGKYQGPLLVNGTLVQAPNAGAVDAPNQNSVLWRTGDVEQSVEIQFTAASGSNLPVNILFQPLPPKK
ncbi:copper amine oxidase N-terminal domain-containing protein [Paenibacillus spiritus]|uniref:Copper amine oxidase N-terminal domain-containing protein n=1 Tax=Paenibacillus spiritus TaxID=2496557 RepID=A0A5J5GHN0_9BACL|nr:copper amine oxidase N-terminal domain-containing protein [Paenibacillus spiritus]KAA9007510.1 copper amine oxidase N-terminal domain-containing protein [Paenibacillus spiritus]